MTRKVRLVFPLAMAATFAALVGCASTGHTENKKPARADDLTPAADHGPARTGFPQIYLDAGAQVTLGEAFRHIGETFGGGAALTAGLEERPAPPSGLAHTGFVPGLERLAKPYDCKLQVTPYYVFFYPRGYEALADLSLEGRVDPRFVTTRASFAIGSGTDLFNALALLGESLKLTIVADNSVADAWCGEVFLEDAPVYAIIEALLKSSRIAPDMIEIESNQDYLFLRSTANQSRPPSCLNREELSADQLAILQTPLTLRLPDTGAAFTFQAEPTTLARVLPDLARALGIPVTADDAMGRLPVNITSFHGIPTETALDLLVRQWPLPRYGYRIRNGGLHFCERPVG
ncbi:MAG: hypothetical protein JNK74_13450 [Candidatus Hydrogenedentes bacterium]|nr:hypothetical protein [Candidatus Hydrogenedentota bacterium]